MLHKHNLLKEIVNLFPKTVSRDIPKNVVILEVKPTESKRINRRYGGKNKPANVLSFLYGPEYGEIIICPALIRREAKKQRNSYEYQKKWMIAHGLLHLAGIHHEKSVRARKKFEQIEQTLLEKLGN